MHKNIPVIPCKTANGKDATIPSKNHSDTWTWIVKLHSKFVLSTGRWKIDISMSFCINTVKWELETRVSEQYMNVAWCWARNGFPQHCCCLSGSRSCSCCSPAATLNLSTSRCQWPWPAVLLSPTLASCFLPHHGILRRAGWGLRAAAGEISEWPEQHHRGPPGWSAQSR